MFVTTKPRQHTTAPTDTTIQTAAGTVFTLEEGEIGFIQNLATEGLAVRYGTAASPTSLCYVLNGATSATSGNGGSVIIDHWVGPVSVAAMTGAESFLAWKVR